MKLLIVGPREQCRTKTNQNHLTNKASSCYCQPMTELINLFFLFFF
jgi:hypothetical protein